MTRSTARTRLTVLGRAPATSASGRGRRARALTAYPATPSLTPTPGRRTPQRSSSARRRRCSRSPTRSAARRSTATPSLCRHTSSFRQFPRRTCPTCSAAPTMSSRAVSSPTRPAATATRFVGTATGKATPALGGWVTTRKPATGAASRPSSRLGGRPAPSRPSSQRSDRRAPTRSSLGTPCPTATARAGSNPTPAPTPQSPLSTAPSRRRSCHRTPACKSPSSSTSPRSPGSTR